MRILLLGASGLVGRHVRSARTGASIHAATKDGRDDTMPVDVTDERALRNTIRAVQPDVIVNAAAEPHVERCEREPEETRRVNVAPIHTLADEAARAGALLVVFSSEYVFDGSHEIAREEDPPSPLNEYGRQKAEVERIARGVERHLICRTSGVFGQEPARKNFVWQVVDTLSRGARFHAPQDQLVTPTYAPSLAQRVVGLVEQGLSGTFHVVGPRVLERDAFARMVAIAFRLDPGLVVSVLTSELHLLARRPRVGLSDEKIRRTVGPTAHLRDALAELAGATHPSD